MKYTFKVGGTYLDHRQRCVNVRLNLKKRKKQHFDTLHTSA